MVALFVLAASTAHVVGTSHIHPFGVTRREGQLARLNAKH